MKKEDIFNELSNIAPAMIAEADPTAPIVTGKANFRRKFTISAICASLALLLAVAIAVVPYFNREEPFTAELPEELLEYSDSEYIRLIYSLYNNNTLGIRDHSSNVGGMILDSMGDNSPQKNYVEVTDNQVEGVIEGDLFKRSKTHIFYADARNKAINVYKIKGDETTLSAQYQIDDTTLDGRGFTPREMYLSENGKTLTVCGVFHDYGAKNYRGNYYIEKTVLASFDVSNPRKIKLKETIVVAGEYVAARVIDGSIYLLYEFGIMNSYNKDYSDETNFVPQIDTGSGFESIDMKDIVITDGDSEDIYTVILRVDEDTLRIEEIKAILCPTNEVFISEDRIILIDNYQKYYEYEENSEKCVAHSLFSNISVITIGKRKMEYVTQFTLAGSVESQYFIDEYNGILRVVANTDFVGWRGDVWLETEDRSVSVRTGDGFDRERDRIDPGTNASLYCIDTKSWNIVAEVANFAPWGEEAMSVRYEGDTAYVCTAEVVTFSDPVYFFDLSDLGNITYTDTGTIEGYSSSLVDFGDGVLLGIGYGKSRSTMKLEVYKEVADKVESVCAYTKDDVWYSEDYKTYYINRELGLVGLMYRLGKQYTYILLYFDGRCFTEVFSENIDETHTDVVRATLIDDCFYIFAQGQYHVVKLNK